MSILNIRQVCPLARIGLQRIATVDFSTTSAPVPKEKVEISQVVHNRNPRNLERLRIAWKPQGYHLEAPGRSYWHKLVLTSSSRFISAKVVHFTGKVVVEASTNEWCIKKHLYNTKDVSAYQNLAKVIARRCLEFGLIEMESDFKDVDPETKVGKFAKIIEEEGITLSEPKRYLPAYPFHQTRPEKPWAVTED
ncbi:large ribosomal subunit protein uL18m [Cloeon dipterum]|uniref:large ribosomal subunit protein uL18m n=1 Tax=Cloeon dipterum TaxID=197152 RepID=UPI00321FAB79